MVGSLLHLIWLLSPPPHTHSDQPDGRSKEESHRRLSISSESDVSTINEDYDVASISSSIDDKLT